VATCLQDHRDDLSPECKDRLPKKSSGDAAARRGGGGGAARGGVALAPIRSRRGTTGAPKKAIVEFVAKVTTEGQPGVRAAAERIATFDNDGTLWAEQPLYFQFLFALDRVKAVAPQHPEWQTKEPFASLLKGDMQALPGRRRARDARGRRPRRIRA
jgi:hypothetical protein